MGQSRRGGKKKVNPTSSRNAEEPEQTINVDLCFVPANHEVREKIAAVSGSSGRLVVTRAKAEKEKDWPGRVFEDEATCTPKFARKRSTTHCFVALFLRLIWFLPTFSEMATSKWILLLIVQYFMWCSG